MYMLDDVNRTGKCISNNCVSYVTESFHLSPSHNHVPASWLAANCGLFDVKEQLIVILHYSIVEFTALAQKPAT